MAGMRVASGTVIAGKVVVDGQPLVEGAKVTVLAAEDGDTFELSAEDEALLLESIAEADREELIDGDDLLRDLGGRK